MRNRFPTTAIMPTALTSMAIAPVAAIVTHIMMSTTKPHENYYYILIIITNITRSHSTSAVWRRLGHFGA